MLKSSQIESNRIIESYVQSNRIESNQSKKTHRHTDIVSMSDHSESSCSLGFVADRSRFRRDSTGGDTPQHHFSASINFDEGRPERPQSRSSTTQPSLKERAPSSGSGMLGLGGEQQPVRRRMPRRPSIDAIKNALDNNGDLSKVATGGGRMQRRPSFGRTPSSNSLGSMANAVEVVKDADRHKQQKQKHKRKQSKEKQQDRRRRSSHQSESSSDDSAYVSYRLQQQSQRRSQTPPSPCTNAPSEQRHHASRRASAEDGVILEKDSLKDIIARRPSESALDTEGTEKRKEVLQTFGTLQTASTIAYESADPSRRSSVGSASRSDSTRSGVSKGRQKEHKSTKERSPSSIISAEAQLAADVSSADAFHQSYRHESSHLSKDQSMRSVLSSQSRDQSRDRGSSAKREAPAKQGTTFYGWGDDGSVTESEYSHVQSIKEKKADDAEVYVGFTNREEFRERIGTADEIQPVEIEEEFDAKRPWRKANAKELHKSSSKDGGISGTDSIKSFNVDETDANVDVKAKTAPFDDDIESIGARRQNSSTGSIDVLNVVNSGRNDDADEISSTSESTLSEFAYAQAVLKRNVPVVDSRPTKRSRMRQKSSDSGDVIFRDAAFDESSEEDPAEAVAIIAQMYRDERKKKVQAPLEDFRDEESRGSSLQESSGDSPDLHVEAAIAKEQKKQRETVLASSSVAKPKERATTDEKAPSRQRVQEPKKVVAQQRETESYERKRNGSSNNVTENDNKGQETKSKDTFEYWNDGYGDVDNRTFDRRSLAIEKNKRLMSSIAGNPAVAYKMGKSTRNIEEAEPFVNVEDGRAESFASRKTAQASNEKNWGDGDKSTSSHGEGSLMAGFPASQKPRGSLEKLLGPKAWQQRKLIFICLGALLLIIIAIAVGVSVSKNNNKPSSLTPTPSPTSMEINPFPTRPPDTSALPYVPLQTVSGTAIFDHAGSALSFNSLGSYVAIGSKQNKSGSSNSEGVIRIYALIGGSWQQVGADIVGFANGDEFGSSVSLSDDGQRVAIGAPNSDVTGESSGSVEVYDMRDKEWSKVGSSINGAEKLDRAGFSVSLSGDGRRVAVGAPRGGEDTGSVRVFEELNGEWFQLGQEIFGDSVAVLAGYAVSLSLKGDTLAMSSPRASTDEVARGGSVTMYNFVDPSTSPGDASWQPMGSLISGDAPGDQTGESIALSSDGKIVAIGANGRDGGRYKNVGYCRVFRFDGQLGDWEQHGKAMYGRDQGEQMGSSIAMSRDATTVACGGPNSRDRSGVVRVYENQAADDDWSQIGDDLSGPLGSAFGSSLALSRDGSFLAVGAPESEVEGNERAGFAEIYTSL